VVVVSEVEVVVGLLSPPPPPPPPPPHPISRIRESIPVKMIDNRKFFLGVVKLTD